MRSQQRFSNARSGWCAALLIAAAACDDEGASEAPRQDGSAAGPDASSEDAARPVHEDAGPSQPANAGRPDGVELCYSALSSNLAANNEFWAAFRGGKLEDRRAAIAGLEQAASEHPEEEEVALLLGLANLWRVAEPLPEEESDMAGFITAASNARSELERAYELCPSDYRIPAWLGPVLVNTGRAIGDDETVAEGLRVLQEGIDHYPQFVLFSKLLVYADRPKDDPDFQLALDAVEENIMVCQPGDPACSNHPNAAHNIEGASVFLADVFAKAGDTERALATYEMAMDAAEYRQWDYQELLADRIATLDARVEAYDNTDAEDDPEAAWTSTYQCSICHRQ